MPEHQLQSKFNIEVKKKKFAFFYFPISRPSTLVNQASMSDRSWIVLPSATTTTSSSSSFPPRSVSPVSKRLKTFVDPSYVKSLELAHELLLLPYVAFTRTSVYANSKLKRNAAYLDSVIEELKKHRLLIMVRQGVQMVDGTRRRVDLLVKCAPMLKDDENNNTNQNDTNDDELSERLGRFGVEYDRYIQTLGTLDIGEKYRLSDQCYELLNSSDYKRYLTIDLERIAPLHRLQQQSHYHSSQQVHPREPEQHRHSIQHEEPSDQWTSSSSSSNIKLEPSDFYT